MFEGALFSYETHPRDLTESAIYQVETLLGNLASIIPDSEKAKLIPRPGGINGYILLDLRECLQKLNFDARLEIRAKFIEFIKKAFDEGALLSILKVRILDFIVPLDLEKIVDAAKYLAPKIKGTWKLEPRTRKLIDRMELIKKVAEVIDEPVDLQNPRFSLNVEVLSNDLVAVYLVDNTREHESIIKPGY
ncbi:MAG: hypothetical protein NDP13_03400 [Crenarchaeota archaeon]|nr:hypothetical protein [Thermoproteota archaeon]MCR8454015.1 hypothetical protein [Thermoproteota archaeon]MCR8454998.1 hypothetical protein [Thermoproteota archaeon]MCR8463614.1 hypothetical protein [Thermoproteota archaeon]MCR8470446.1 hypothetical protein [Thermoproteota archaeon]